MNPIQREWQRSPYLHIFFKSILSTTSHYRAWLGLSLFLITCLVIYSHLWKVLQPHVDFLSHAEPYFFWYIAYNQWVLSATPDIQEVVESEIVSAKVSHLLPRPISYFFVVLSEGCGALFANLLILGIVIVLYGIVACEIPYFEWRFLLGAALLGVMGGVLALLAKIGIGLCAFWISQVSPIEWFWEKLLFLFGGLMMPLFLYPSWLQKVAFFTPFPWILGGRSAFIFSSTWVEFVSVFSILCFWLVCFFYLVMWLFKKGIAKIGENG